MAVRRRGARWLAVVELGRDERGRRRRRYVSCASESEAKREEAVLRAGVLTGTYTEPSTETLAAFLAEWQRHANRGARASLIEARRQAIERHIVPALGPLRLAALRPLHVERFVTAQSERYAPATVAKRFWTLHKALDRAVAWGKLARNPADAVEKPRLEQPAVRCLSVTEQAALLGRSAGHWLHGFVLLGLATGMRRGELCALEWRDVDLSAGIVCVRRAKTRAGLRRVRLPQSVTAYLADERVKQRALYAAVSSWRERGYVLAREDGTARRPDSVTAAFARLCKGLDISNAHFHCLRHTFATEMLAAGVPVKVVSEMLGHAAPQTTLAIYAHVLADMQDAAVLCAERLVSDARAVSTQDGSGEARTSS